ncbi:MAG: hypothetical protein EPO68_14125 [Planctomycetota bacterium]|nr:MAG: hypothetical protein EPO68_14125 [Planctomycetota bacterium]
MNPLRRLSRSLAVLSATAVLCAPAIAQSFLNKPLPKVQLASLHQTSATSLDDFTGRALLIEFFAHW